MLPSGHIAAGYLVAEAILQIAKPALSHSQNVHLLWWGAFFGFTPDLDMFYAFWRAKGFTLPRKEVNHRFYLTHRPMVWLAASLLIWLFATSPFWKTFALVVWLGSWSHFILDSLRVGVMWLWPFSNKFYALYKPGEREGTSRKSFYDYWMWFLNFYTTDHPVTFYLEILVLVAATAVWGLSQKGIL